MSRTLNTSSLDIVIQDLKKFSTYQVTVAGYNRLGKGLASHVYITTDEDGKTIAIFLQKFLGLGIKSYNVLVQSE